ncbi:phosphopantetheine-binding protein, partial [Streptosporangium sp. NPDC051022]|uniref:phosphopantetheine-binding protein n=1 Tax=Streptosporangium sp. NPDC051022 TaxID=3155752 RepID=UPI00344A9B56
RPGHTPTTTDLRTHLTPHLPDYMIPTTYLHLPSMPLTHNGKTDRNALPPPHTCTPLPTTGEGEEQQGPATPLHHTLAHIWTEVLDVPNIALGDNFFTLGGHSLAAVRLLFMVRDQLKVELSLRDLYETEDFAAFSARVDELLPPDTGSAPGMEPAASASDVGSAPSGGTAASADSHDGR